MEKMNEPKSSIEKGTHLAFMTSLFMKGIYSSSEVITGVLIALTPQATIISYVNFLTTLETSSESSSLFLPILLLITKEISISSQSFVSLYLIIHGSTKLLLITGLVRGQRWAYLTTFIIFPLFIMYELYRFSWSHSPWLLAATTLNVLIIILTMTEYHFSKRHSTIT